MSQATLPTTGAADGATDQVSLNFPENLELKVLIEYVSQRLGINIYYDDQTVNQRVTIKAPQKIPQQSLLPLLESVLQLKGLVMVEGDQPGWKRIVPATGLIAAARPATQPLGATTRPASSAAAVTQVFVLQYIDPAKLEAILRPFLTQPGGNSIAYPEQRMLLVTDYATNVARLAELVGLLDQPLRKVTTQFVHVEHVDAQQLAAELTQLMSVKQRAQGGAATAAAVEIVPDPRTNQLAFVGDEAGVGAAVALAKSMDVALDARTVMYEFKFVSAEQVDKIARELIGNGDSKRTYQAAVDKESNILVVTAPDEVHKRIESLKQSMDVGGSAQEQQNPVRFYQLANTSADEVLQTIKAIEGQEDLGQLKLEGSAQGAGVAAPAAPTPPPVPQGTYPPVAVPPHEGLGTESTLVPTAPAGIHTVKTKEATVTADRNTNSIIVVARPAVQQVYEELIRRLDKSRPQVLIECTIVTLDTSNDSSLGIEISTRVGAGGTDLITFSSFGLSTVSTGKSDPGHLTLTPGVGFNGTLIATDLADIVVRALAHSGRAQVVSAPRILVNDNTTGTLASVSEAPFTSVNASTTVATTSFVGYASAGTTVTVTPHISEGDHLQLEYALTLNNFSGSGGQGIPPPRQSNTINSKVTIPDGSTIIVGGLNRKDYSNTVDAVPILGQIPILQYFFSNRDTTDHSSTLFVFIRPVILRDDQFQDLKYFSARDVTAAGVQPDLPASEPMVVR